MLIGIVGAVVGGFIYSRFVNPNYVTHFNIASFIVAFIGALVLLIVYRLIVRGRRV